MGRAVVLGLPEGFVEGDSGVLGPTVGGAGAPGATVPGVREGSFGEIGSAAVVRGEGGAEAGAGRCVGGAGRGRGRGPYRTR
ncbi:hypothetical protein [Streptomyces camponoticapitis]|uniref:hypothetical protein n=1 Tax=Streptomyces camponoticapitis TaxID=1616125 RepID=UPI00166F62B1|nr:hypothetical protein [Streptomyces camponoticapitis]